MNEDTINFIASIRLAIIKGIIDDLTDEKILKWLKEATKKESED